MRTLTEHIAIANCLRERDAGAIVESVVDWCRLSHKTLSSKGEAMFPGDSSSIIIALFCFTICVSYNQTCPTGTYYDNATDRCDSCADLCVNSFSRGTDADCKKSCPNYRIVSSDTLTSKPACPVGQYYDHVTSRCDFCSALCDNNVIQGTTDDCKLNCPEYLKNKTSSLSESSPTKVAGISVAVSVCVVVVVVCVYALLVFCCESRLPSWLQMKRFMPCLREAYNKPIECTEASTPSSGSSQSVLFDSDQQDTCAVLLADDNSHDIQLHGAQTRYENNI